MTNENRYMPDLDGGRNRREAGVEGGRKEEREGKKKKEGRGGMERKKMKKRKCKLFYNLDLTSSLSQTCFTEYVSLGAYNATTTEQPASSDTA